MGRVAYGFGVLYTHFISFEPPNDPLAIYRWRNQNQSDQPRITLLSGDGGRTRFKISLFQFFLFSLL